MLEKIGLPAKPSMRGSNWVVDASHCQGCSSQFTFINRKHHCRRCGGIFCNSCTQQRMVLRGQGDSPVRICEPCKTLEDAARFEMRHGYKSRVGRGGSKVGMKYEDEVLNKINIDGKQSSLSGRGSTTSSEVSDVDRAIGIASSSSYHEEAAKHDGKEDEPQSDTLDEIGSNSPEELRQQAVEEKKKYRILKGENKPEEALRAFKRGKELERQAKALEIALRKSHRKALSSNSLASIQKTNDDLAESSIKSKSSNQMRKENKDDLVDELRELGWSDADLHDADKKPAKISLEGELSSLLRESHSKSTVDKGTGGIDKTQVMALKKKALAFKREGKIAEAKEELKRAKILEKQLEEQAFLGGEDSDDEISALIRSMDDDKEDDILLYREKDAGSDYDHLLGGAADLGDGLFDVTDEDMNDPEMTAALKSLGWTEDLDQQEVKPPPSVFVDVNALRNEILSLKKEAVNQKRAGNASEVLTLLRKAKLLEKDIEKFESQGSSSFAPNSMTQEGSTSQIAKKSSLPMKMDQGKFESVEDINSKLPPKSKLMIQKELLGIKKKALALRREGRFDEADEELKKGKVLEYQLEEMENASKPSATKESVIKDSESIKKKLTNYEMSDCHLEIDGDVTEKDMHDPALLSQLEKLGWTNESIEHESLPSEPFKRIDNKSEHVTDSVIQATSEVPVITPRRSKAEIQRELLQLKRKALALRRQGEAEEVEDVLKMAKALEAQMEAIEAPNRDFVANSATAKEPGSFGSHTTQKTHGNTESTQENRTSKPPRSPVKEEDEAEVTEEDMHDPMLLSQLNDMGWKDEIVEPISTVKPRELSVNNFAQASSEIPVVAARRTKAEVQRELLGLKRKALNLRRQGEAEEVVKVLKLAKELEVQLEEMSAPKKDLPLDSSRDNKPEAFGAIISQEKPGNMKDVEVRRLSELTTDLNDGSSELLGLDLNKSIAAKPPPLSSVDVTHEMSKSIEDKSPLIEMPESLADTTVGKDVCSFPQSGQSVQFMDLLTGGDWQNSESSVKDKGDEGSFTYGIISEDNSYVQPEVLTNPETGTGSKSEIMHGKEVKTVGTIQKTQVHDTNSDPISNTHSNGTSFQQEILARKRKAVSLKREGKLVEAREELRQAKLLEKSLQEDDPQPDAASIDVQISINDTSPQKDDHRKASQATKPMTGRDRFKLQQESLAHKRQALKLRREGRIDEAEAEFELAKSLESQLEESASHDSSKVSSKRVNETEAMDDLGVEDLLDPQLLSALKAIGLQDVEIAPQVSSERPESAKLKIGQPETSNQEKNQLEELIKAEKVKAVNLKRAGKQSEALDALRRAKMYEKKLNSPLS